MCIPFKIKLLTPKNANNLALAFEHNLWIFKVISSISGFACTQTQNNKVSPFEIIFQKNTSNNYVKPP